MERFVRPDIRTLTISDGDTLVVRARLTAGERRARMSRMWLAGVDGKLTVNPMQVGLATITAYLLDWSLKDASGRTVMIRELAIADLERTIDQLDGDTYDEILAAIQAHEEAMDAERAAQKKTATGTPGRAPHSLSPSDAAGAMNGSATSTPILTTS